MTARWVLVGAAVAIVVVDLMQVALVPWRPKHVGALAGAALYATIAAGAAWRDAAWADRVAIVVPLIPLSILALASLGVSLPVKPDGGMILALGFQLAVAAAGGWRLLLRRRSAAARRGR